MKRYLLLGACAFLCVGGHAALAQDITDTTPRTNSIFARNRSVSVTERMIPGYDRTGTTVGIFNVRPQLLVSGFYSDNLFADENNPDSDAALIVSPTVNAVADVQNTRIGISGMLQYAKYLSRGSQDNTVYRTRGTVNHDFGSGFSLGGDLGYERAAERRSDPGAIVTSLTPILFDTARAGARAEWEGARIRVRGIGSYAHIDFRDGENFDGTRLSQRYRDRNVYRLGGLADYAVSADLALRGQVNFVKSNFKRPDALNLVDRSTERIEVLGGASFEFTDLLRGEFGLGYIHQRFTNNDRNGYSGLGGRGQLEYLATPLTTFTLRASRTIEDAGLADTPTFIRTTVTLSADHELYRNVIVSAYGGYSSNRFQQPSQRDNRPAFGASAVYKANRNLSIIARYDYLNVTSSPDNALREFSLNTASIGIDVGL